MALVDIGLWVLAVLLTIPALWWSRRVPRSWDASRLYAGIRGDTDLRQAGEDWQPSEWLGAGITWENLRDPVIETPLKRKLEGVRLIWLGPSALVLPGLEGASVEAPRLPLSADDEKRMDAVVGEARQVVMAAGPENGMNLLKLLHAAPGLRDRCRAILLVGLEPEKDWIEKEFTHTAMDTEVYRQVPYLCLRLRPDSPTLSTPPVPPTSRTAIEVVDLGVGNPEDSLLGRAVILLIAALAW